MQSLARWWRTWTQTRTEVEAEELREEFHLHGHGDDLERIDCCVPGQLSVVTGLVRSISVRPKSNVPAFEVELFDGTGALTVIWLGRRRIAGVDPGRRMVVRGRLAQGGEHRVMYNPRYELKPAAA